MSRRVPARKLGPIFLLIFVSLWLVPERILSIPSICSFANKSPSSARTCREGTRKCYSRVVCVLNTGNINDTGRDDIFNHSFHTLPRLYVGGTTTAPPLAPKVQIPLTPEQAHYVTKVMRMGTKKSRDSMIRIFDGTNGEWLAQIRVLTSDGVEANMKDKLSGNKRRRRQGEVMNVVAQCQRQLRSQPDSSALLGTQPWLFFAPIKKARVKLVLEKATELGVAQIMPILTERCDPASVRDCCLPLNIEKLAIYTLEAAEQCERLTVPPVTLECGAAATTTDADKEPWNLKQLLKTWSLDSACYQNLHLLLCRERSARECLPLLKVLREQVCEQHDVAFVIGPEGGWSVDEQAMMDEYCHSNGNIHSVSLGSLVLRAETAAIAALGAYMLYKDDDTVY